VNRNPDRLRKTLVGSLPWVLVVSSVLWWAGRTARANEQDVSDAPGYVDGAVFRDIADQAPDHTTLVDVTLNGPMLKVLARAFASQDDQVAGLLTGLEAINAVIIGFDEKNDDLRERARREVRNMVQALPEQGWDRLARVREEGEDIHVLARRRNEELCGLIVLVSERKGREITFVNIVGKIDLGKMGLLGASLNLPGLERVPAEDKRPPEQAAPRRKPGDSRKKK
jgi:hypothetical protein